MPSQILTESRKKQAKAAESAANLRTVIEADFSKMNQNNKESMVAEMLFNAYLSNTYAGMEYTRKNKAAQDLDKILNDYGLQGEDAIFYEASVVSVFRDNHSDFVAEAEKELMKNDENYFHYDVDVILFEKNGENRLREYYMAEIKNSSAYENILAAQDTEELKTAIATAMERSKRGLNAFPDVELPNEAAGANASCSEAYVRETGHIKDSVNRYLINHYWTDEVKHYALTDLSANGLKNNSVIIDKLYEEINGVDYFTSSPNFRNMKKELLSLKKMAATLASNNRTLSLKEKNAYANKVRKVISLSDYYLSNKTNTDSTYARNRIKQVRLMRRHLSTNIMNLNDTYSLVSTKLEKNAFGHKLDLIDKYNALSPANSGVFLGRHSLNELKDSDFSLSRAAGYSLSIFAMINRGYNIRDIMDPDKLQAEKRQMFDEILRRTKSGLDEDKEWIAKEIYTAFPKAEAFMDECFRQIDFSAPDYLQDENFALLYNFSQVNYDIYQEMFHADKQMDALIAKDPSQVKNIKEYGEKRYIRCGFMNVIKEDLDKMREPIAQIKLNPDTDDNLYQTLIIKAVDLQYFKNVMKAAKEKNLSYSELADKSTRTVLPARTGIQNYLQEYPNVFINHKEETRILLGQIMDTSLFKNVKFNLDPNKPDEYITGLPMDAEILAAAKTEVFLQKAEKAVKRFENGKFETIDAVRNYAKDAAMIAVAELYRLSGSVPVDHKTKKPISLSNAAKRLEKNSDFQKMLRKKTGMKELKNPKTLIKDLRNPAKLQKIALIASGKGLSADKKTKPGTVI